MKKMIILALMALSLAVPAFAAPAENVTIYGTIGAAGKSVQLTVNGYGGFVARVSGTWAGTLVFYGTIDGANYFPLLLSRSNSDICEVSTTTNNVYLGPCSGLKNVQIYCTAYTSGTAEVNLSAGPISLDTVTKRVTVFSSGVDVGSYLAALNNMSWTGIGLNTTITNGTTVLDNSSTWVAGQKTVAAAGTAEVLPTNTIPFGKSIEVEALSTNTGNVYLADSKAEAEAAATAWTLKPGQRVEMIVSNTNKVWVDAAVNGEGVQFKAEK